MRFLHTSDWHIGKTLRGHRRDEECHETLAEVLEIARDRQVDYVLIAGDVFDSAMPSPEDERIVFGFFRELAGARIPAVVIGGNHDHPKRLGAFARILELVDIHVRGDSVPAAQGGVLEIPSRDGTETAVVATLPWVPERKAREWESMIEGGERPFLEYAEEVARRMSDLATRFRSDTINILLSHVMLHGALVGPDGGERPLHLGQTYAVKPQRLPTEAHYTALGHLHKPQVIRVRPPAQYSGSLLQLDFGEQNDKKSVVLIEAHPSRPAHVETVPLSAGRRLRDLEGTLAELQTLAADTGDDYLRVRVHVDGPSPGLTRQVREVLPNALEVVPIYPDRERTESDQRLRTLSPDQLLAEYHQATYGSAVPAPVLDLFRRLQEEVDRATP